ncbi:hypothetical protein CSB85_2887 [Pseudomonas aeruginosa]|nr:hypothetical protein CSB97_2727 [Pseudomonas aeruginosa]AVK23614.1 hypothetical protein CSB85_2887 [Pseudomonas aeruginosa]AWE81508.1 hypothetical protein CSC31_1014 [Pseudomonas aeruginosa]
MPAPCNFGLDDFCLSHMALPGCVRAGQNASQEQIHIEWLTHARPPM